MMPCFVMFGVSFITAIIYFLVLQKPCRAGEIMLALFCCLPMARPAEAAQRRLTVWTALVTLMTHLSSVMRRARYFHNVVPRDRFIILWPTKDVDVLNGIDIEFAPAEEAILFCYWDEQWHGRNAGRLCR